MNITEANEDMSFSEKEKERIRNVLGFFVKESNKNILLVALFKRLFFLDRRSFLETGVPFTKYTYSAKPQGPVPMGLEWELKGLDNPNPEFVGADTVIKLRKPPSTKAEYDEYYYDLTDWDWEINKKIFTPYELRLLEEIADCCKDKTGAELTQEAHKCCSWRKAFQSGRGDGENVDFYDEAGSHDDPYTGEEREIMDKARHEMAQLFSTAET